MADLTKGYIGKQDLAGWDGTTSKTFSRPTSTGGTENINYLDGYVDVLSAYGSGTDRTTTTLANAVSAVSTNKRSFFLDPGTWAIDADLTIPSNITLICPPGCILSIATTKTLTLETTSIEAGPYQIFTLTGTGTVAFADGSNVKSGWFASFEIAVGAISTSKVELEVSAANSIADNLTLNANTSLKWTSAGKILTVATTKTLTVNTVNIDAGLYPIFTFTGTGTASFSDGVNLKSSWFESFEEAIAAISTVKVELEVSAAASIADDLTINANTWLEWTSAGKALTVANTKTLTVSGGIIAPNVEIFTGTGTVAGTTLADFIQPLWDNAGLAAYTLAIGTTGICTTFIQTLMDDTTAAIARTTLGASSSAAIYGEGTSDSELRSMYVLITDAAEANKIDVTIADGFCYNNYVAVSVTNLAKGTSDSGVALSADGSTLTFDTTALSGTQDIKGIISGALQANSCGTKLLPVFTANASSIICAFFDGENCDGTREDLTSLVDVGVGTISYRLAYITA